MPTRFVWTLLLLALFGGIHPARAITRNVPSQYPTIQAAINAAAPGDTVLVADGTYSGTGFQDIDFGGKNLVVTSVNGASSTTININATSSNRHRAFIFQHGEAASAIVSGFTVENGYPPADNTGNYNGGAIYITGSSPSIYDCVFRYNQAIYGGAIYLIGGSATLSGCAFSRNSALYGGAVMHYYSSPLLTVTACAFNGNTATDQGGALYTQARLTLINSTFVGNVASDGGGLYAYTDGPSQTVVNCTFTANTASDGGGVYAYRSSSASQSFTNDILYRDTANNGNEIYVGGSAPTVTYSDVQGGYSGTGNINADPLFVRAPNLNANPPDYGDLHLQNGSPCIGAGTASGAPATDFDGNPRPNPPSIGAYDVTNSDTNAPTTTASLSGTVGNNGYYVSSVQVTLNATDNGGSGVAVTYYKVDGGSYHGYTGAFTVSGDGSHTVTFYSVDNDGNSETPHSVSIAIDTTPPTTSISTSPGYITLSATDNFSGVAATYNTLDGSAFAPYVGPIHVYGPHDLTFYSVDYAGNVEAVKSAHVSIPYPVPHLNSLSPSSANAGGPAFTLTVDGTGFTRKTVVKWNGSALTTTFVSATQVTAHVPASYIANVGTAAVKATNPTPGGGASNSLTFTVTGAGPPVTTASLSGTVGNNGYYVSAVKVTLSVTDPNGAGYVAATYYKIDGGGYQTYSGAFTVSGNGSHTVTFYSVDNGGQSETPHSVSFAIDSTPPTTAHSLVNNPQGIKVTLTPSDNVSGVAATYYGVDGSAYQTYSAPFEVVGFGYHNVAFYSVDNAGNVEAAQVISANINYPVPSITSLSPASAQAGGPGFTLTVNGHYFNTGSVVAWNGTALTTTFVAYQKVTAFVPASLIASTGTASITVVNPAPGGGTSNAETFTITGAGSGIIKVTVGTTSRASGVITMHLVVQNTGSQDTQNVTITAAQLGATGTTTTLPLPLGTVTAGGSVNVSLTFPGSAGASGSTKTLAVSGTYTGGMFTSSQSITLP